MQCWDLAIFSVWKVEEKAAKIINNDNCLLNFVFFLFMGCVGKDRDKLVDLYSPQLDGTKETNLAPHLALCPLRVYTHWSRYYRQDITVKDSNVADSGTYCLEFHDKKNREGSLYVALTG